LLQAIGALDGKSKGRYAMEQTEMTQEGEFGVGKSKVRPETQGGQVLWPSTSIAIGPYAQEGEAQTSCDVLLQL
jgi:hypothetical protein